MQPSLLCHVSGKQQHSIFDSGSTVLSSNWSAGVQPVKYDHVTVRVRIVSLVDSILLVAYVNIYQHYHPLDMRYKNCVCRPTHMDYLCMYMAILHSILPLSVCSSYTILFLTITTMNIYTAVTMF